MKGLWVKLKRKIKFGKGRKRKGRGGISLFSMRKASGRSVGRRKNLGGGIVIFVVFGAVFFLFVWSVMCIYKLVTAEFQRAYKDESVDDLKEWRGEGRINILLVGMDKREGEFGYADAVVVLMVDPIDRRLGIFNINVDTTVGVSHSKDYKLRNLYNTGLLEGDEAPIDSLIGGVETLLSLKINRYIIIDEESLVDLVDALGGVYVSNPSTVEDLDLSEDGNNVRFEEGAYRLSGKDLLNYIRVDDDSLENKFIRQIGATEGFLKRAAGYNAFIRFPTFIRVLQDGVNTNLSRRELIRFGYEIMRLQETTSAFMGRDSLDKVELEGEEVFIPIYEVLDQDIQAVFGDAHIAKEQARVEIFNSTNIRGLAAFRERWLRNIGVDIIRTGDTSKHYEKTTIFTHEPKKYKNTINAIKKSFDEEIEVVEDMPEFICTGDVIVVLGENAQK